MLQKGNVINGIYEVIEPIGEGGAGQVYLAWHKNLEKNVVIKRIKDNFVGRMNERGEADILKKLHHRYLPQVYDFIQMEREIYTVIDYIDGNTLMDYINSGVRFDEQQILKWLKQLCEALDYLHTQTPPIIHSDIKPSNIMVDKNGDICLIDFNISFGEDDMKKISGYSAGYASPEQILKVQRYTSGGNYKEIRLDAKSDIFSLGASIYHIMTMQNPIKVISEHKDLWDVALAMPYSSLLIDVIEKALRRDAKERYQTAKEMLLDLESMKVRDQKYRQLSRIQLAYNIAALAVLAAGIYFAIRSTTLLKAEAFDNEYSKIVSEAAEDDYDKIVSDAIDLLNNEKYASIMDNRQREKADLLYMIANSYFERDDYQNAIPFYKDTVDTDSSNPEYYRDYAIASARLGDIDEAERILGEGISKGLRDADLFLVEAEIGSAKGEWDAAVDNFRKAIDTTDNETTLGRAYYLCAKAYRSKGELAQAKTILDEAYNTVNDTWRRRILGEEGSLCLQYLEENGSDTDWEDEAERCYRTLTNTPQGTMNDWMNYALILRIKGDIEEGIAVLEGIKTKYSDEYAIPKRQALFEIEAQSRAEEGSRDYSKAEEYYNEAEKLYEKSRNSGNSDDEMQYLESLMQELHDKGWL